MVEIGGGQTGFLYQIYSRCILTPLKAARVIKLSLFPSIKTTYSGKDVSRVLVMRNGMDFEIVKDHADAVLFFAVTITGSTCECDYEKD